MPSDSDIINQVAKNSLCVAGDFNAREQAVNLAASNRNGMADTPAAAIALIRQKNRKDGRDRPEQFPHPNSNLNPKRRS